MSLFRLVMGFKQRWRLRRGMTYKIGFELVCDLQKVEMETEYDPPHP